ncbi:polynucleotide adenylyltransferase [Candidatus Thioglobus sp.]|jgi:tRNA nucleotidyltransferase (CCA-adding enzyme)|uniref:polynucleotide adenylyltransferase n=1 Tax=Candidatus Thioglobus sp. TaxID=2026721 RepID=UPI003242AF58
MKKYLVGGAVRDRLLGISDNNTEKDWVVVGSSPDEMLDLGYRQVGKEFPVFLHPGTQEEYALARLERKVGKGYKGFEFDTSKSVTLEQDLSRRDLTINAIAEKDEELFDPFNGQEDLNNGLLKHVSDAFSEDPVRVLRVARFAARFKPFGFKVAHETHRLMKDMVASGEVDALTPERVFKELEKALSYETPSAFFKVLSACGADAKVFPMLSSNAHTTHDNEFEFLDHLKVNNPAIKFAVWLNRESIQSIAKLCKVIKCPKEYEQLALLSSEWSRFANVFIQHDSKEILEFFTKTDALRRKERFKSLLVVFELLDINIQLIVQLQDQLSVIDVSKLDKNNIAKAIVNKKMDVITLFIDSTK